MLRKGFTLIELLIVITIIAILAGAAIPYVADYIEEGRKARAKQDLTEIRNALVRWELERGTYTATTIEPLVGPFLSQLLIDPWGAPYYVDDPRSHVRSYGLDGIDGNGIGDDYALDFRPPMACTKCEYTDIDGTGSVTTGDTYTFYFTRPVAAATGDLSTVTIGGIGLDDAGFVAPVISDRTAVSAIGAAPPAIAGNAVVLAGGNGNGFSDENPDLPTISWAKAANLKLKATGF